MKKELMSLFTRRPHPLPFGNDSKHVIPIQAPRGAARVWEFTATGDGKPLALVGATFVVNTTTPELLAASNTWLGAQGATIEWVEGSPGRLRLSIPADFYAREVRDYLIEVATVVDGVKDYSAMFALEVTPSSHFGNEIALPPQEIDFAKVVAINAPWMEAADLSAFAKTVNSQPPGAAGDIALDAARIPAELEDAAASENLPAAGGSTAQAILQALRDFGKWLKGRVADVAASATVAQSMASGAQSAATAAATQAGSAYQRAESAYASAGSAFTAANNAAQAASTAQATANAAVKTVNGIPPTGGNVDTPPPDMSGYLPLTGGVVTGETRINNSFHVGDSNFRYTRQNVSGDQWTRPWLHEELSIYGGAASLTIGTPITVYPIDSTAPFAPPPPGLWETTDGVDYFKIFTGRDPVALKSDIPAPNYALATASGASVTLAPRTATALSANGGALSIALAPAPAGFVGDCILVLTTGATVPAITYPAGVMRIGAAVEIEPDSTYVMTFTTLTPNLTAMSINKLEAMQ